MKPAPAHFPYPDHRSLGEIRGPKPAPMEHAVMKGWWPKECAYRQLLARNRLHVQAWRERRRA